MRLSTFKYSLEQGIKNIARNRMFSIASIATMSVCIFLFGIFYSIITNFNYIVEGGSLGSSVYSWTSIFDFMYDNQILG